MANTTGWCACVAAGGVSSSLEWQAGGHVQARTWLGIWNKAAAMVPVLSASAAVTSMSSPSTGGTASLVFSPPATQMAPVVKLLNWRAANHSCKGQDTHIHCLAMASRFDLDDLTYIVGDSNHKLVGPDVGVGPGRVHPCCVWV